MVGRSGLAGFVCHAWDISERCACGTEERGYGNFVWMMSGFSCQSSILTSI
jgi:hypothetical protein